MYLNVQMCGWETTRRHDGQILAPVCRCTVTVMAADADGYTCTYS